MSFENLSKILKEIKSFLCADFFAVGTGSFLGVLIRVGLSNIVANARSKNPANTNPSTESFDEQTFLVTNCIGCFIMAFTVTYSEKLNSFSPALYKYLTTGLCGCITTFSSWMNGAIRQSFTAQNTISQLINLLFTFAVTWSAFLSGFGVAALLKSKDSKDIDELVTPVVTYTPITSRRLFDETTLKTTVDNEKYLRTDVSDPLVCFEDFEDYDGEVEKARKISLVSISIKSYSEIIEEHFQKNEFFYTCTHFFISVIILTVLTLGYPNLFEGPVQLNTSKAVLIAPIGA